MEGWKEEEMDSAGLPEQFGKKQKRWRERGALEGNERKEE